MADSTERLNAEIAAAVDPGKKLPPEVRRSLYRVKVRPLEASEADLKRCVLHLANQAGWRRYHPLPGVFVGGNTRGRQIRTLYEGEAGWPDCSLWRRPMRADHPWPGVPARPARAIFRELKDQRGQLTDEQDEWLEVGRLAGLDVGVWRPLQWANEIAPTLV